MKTRLEKHTRQYWQAMLKLRGPMLSQTFARQTELPKLKATTPFASLQTRIRKVLENVPRKDNGTSN